MTRRLLPALAAGILVIAGAACGDDTDDVGVNSETISMPGLPSGEVEIESTVDEDAQVKVCTIADDARRCLDIAPAWSTEMPVARLDPGADTTLLMVLVPPETNVDVSDATATNVLPITDSPVEFVLAVFDGRPGCVTFDALGPNGNATNVVHATDTVSGSADTTVTETGGATGCSE